MFSPLTTDWLITCSHLFVHFSLRLWSLTDIDSPVPSSMNIKHALDCQELRCADILFAKKFAELIQINSNSNTPRNQNVKWNIFQTCLGRNEYVFLLNLIDRSQSIFLFVPHDKNTTVKLTGLVDNSFLLQPAKLIFVIIWLEILKLQKTRFSVDLSLPAFVSDSCAIKHPCEHLCQSFCKILFFLPRAQGPGICNDFHQYLRHMFDLFPCFCLCFHEMISCCYLASLYL